MEEHAAQRKVEREAGKRYAKTAKNYDEFHETALRKLISVLQ